MRQPALVLVNPHAASGRAARMVPRLKAALRGLPVPGGTELRVADGVDDARAALMDWPTGGRVVLVGGDGTLHAMLPALLKQRHSLALLPCGTGNDGARALGVHRLSLDAALHVALDGADAPVDTGLVTTVHGQWPFFSSLAAGFDAAVGARALRGPARLRGTLRYLWATLGELRTLSPRTLRVDLDGECVHDGPALFASSLNTPTYGSGMPVTPQARLDDGQLDLLLAGDFTRLGALAMLPRLMAGRHLGHPRVHTWRFSRLRLRAGTPCPLAADGDPLPPAADVTVEVRPSSLRVVRPAAPQV